MDISTFKQQTTEIFVEGNGVTVTVNPWGNLEGLNFMVFDDKSKGAGIRCCGSFTWEESDILVMALTAARCT